ncbi:MAG: hypothetical protein AAFX53_12770 [Bacteroidota bacterium]
MFFKKFGWLLFLATVNLATAQVKIGENPNTIHGTSILELESNDKALVLTRLSSGQMNALSPLLGAMVYNTDTQCIHFFDGAQWTNLCQGANGASVVANGDGTYTWNDGNGGTISFNGADETTSTLVDNFDGTYTYTDETGTLTTISFTATDSQTLSTDGTPGNISISNGNSLVLNIDDADADVQNEIQDLQFASGIITLTEDPDGTSIDLNPYDASSHITALQAEQVTQNDAIALNTAKTGITPAQAAIIAATSGTNTGDQDISGIGDNATDITALQAEQVTQNDAIALNTAKTGITPTQAAIIANTSGTNTGDQDISGIGDNATDIAALQAEQVTQNDAIALNTAKTGITPAQAAIIAATSGANTGDQDISGIGDNATDITALQAEQVTQNDAIALNTAKTGITPAQAAIIAATSGTNTGDQDISGIGDNATDISALQTEQVTQNDAIALNTAKTGITPAQAAIIAATSGTNTGDQDISGIGDNATDIANNTTAISNNTTGVSNNAADITALQASKTNHGGRWTNSDTTTNLNVNNTIAPIFGSQDYVDGGTDLYEVSGNTLIVKEAGRYDMRANLSLEGASSPNNARQRTNVNARIAINGVPISAIAASGYIRWASNHNHSSLHLNEILELSANDVVTVVTFREANSGAVSFSGADESSFMINKLR